MKKYVFYRSAEVTDRVMGRVCRFLPLLLLVVVLVVGNVGVLAQSRQKTQAQKGQRTLPALTGQVFGNPNISNMTPEQFVANVQSRAEKREKELGRELTEADIEKLAEDMAQGMGTLKSIQLLSTISVTVKFLPDSKAEMKMKVKLKEDLLKDAGVSWIQRKTMKTMLGMLSNTVKERYVRKGNLIIISPGKDPDTLRLSPDGRKLYGKIEEGFPYTLTRQSGKK